MNPFLKKSVPDWEKFFIDFHPVFCQHFGWISFEDFIQLGFYETLNCLEYLKKMWKGVSRGAGRVSMSRIRGMKHSRGVSDG